MITYDEFRLRAEVVRRRIDAACARAGRNPAEVQLLAVTKTHPAEAAQFAGRYGLKAVGENRVQEGVEKRGQCGAALRWELIGHLQSNKAALAARTFDRIQSVDTPKLAEYLDRAAAAAGKILPVLLQVNAADDPAKFGAAPADAAALLEAALGRPALRVEGLMTIARLSPDPAVAARCFGELRELRERLAVQFATPLAELSMGMSGDLDAAIAAGSTLVRVGSALFGERA